MDTDKKKARVALLSVASNTTLVVLKVAVGLLSGSISVLSEAVHSAVDLVAAVIALVAVKTASKPADPDHPFGHGKIENVSGTVEALLIFAAAAWIIYESIAKLLHPAPVEMPALALAVMAFSAGVNVVVSRKLFRVGEETDSIALKADGMHLRTDVWTSVGVAVALGAIALARWLFPGTELHWLDPVAAIAVALLIVKAAYELTRDSARDLLDASLPGPEGVRIRELIAKYRPTVRGYHKLRTRKAGSRRFVEMHMLVSPEMTVGESHHLTDLLGGEIRNAFPGTVVTIHVEPCEGVCSQECVDGCLLDDAGRAQIHSLRRHRRLATTSQP